MFIAAIFVIAMLIAVKIMFWHINLDPFVFTMYKRYIVYRYIVPRYGVLSMFYLDLYLRIGIRLVGIKREFSSVEYFELVFAERNYTFISHVAKFSRHRAAINTKKIGKRKPIVRNFKCVIS